MAIIDTATVKLNLGIATGTTTYDASIATFIPQVEAIVKQYTGKRFNTPFVGSITNASAIVGVASIENTYFFSEQTMYTVGSSVGYNRYSAHLSDYFRYGDYVTGTGIAAGAFITDVDDYNKQVTLSANCTVTNTTATLTQGFNLALNRVTSQLVWFFVNRASIAAANATFDSIASKSQGQTSVSYANVALDKKYGVPVDLLAGLNPFRSQKCL